MAHTLISSLIWIDLEMTGLNPDQEKILEIALILTDKNLTITAHGPRLVIFQPEIVLESMDSWCKKQHADSGLLEEVRKSKLTENQAEQEILRFVSEHITSKAGYLAGNSIWVDRMFLRAHMPQFEQYLNYRMIDVSTIKELINTWYKNSPLLPYQKKEQHRADHDILESLQELSFYRKNFFIEF